MENNTNEVINTSEEKSIFYKIVHNKWFKNLLIFVLVFSTTFTAFRITIESTFVNGNSMYPTLKHKQFALTYKLGFKIGSIKRFDIITFDFNDDVLVKRVIGLPNETLTYTEGVLYIDGKVVEENFISDAYKMETAKKKGGSFTVKLGEKEYFVMGDNRKVNCSNDNYCSFDSRSFGSIRYEDIRSRGLTIIGKCKSIEGDKCVGKSFSWPKAVK